MEIGNKVLIRDHMAGVFFGTLAEFDLKAGTWMLKGARKIHYWVRAGAVEGVAVRGIDQKQSRVTARVDVAGRSMVQICLMSEEQYAALDACPEWRP